MNHVHSERLAAAGVAWNIVRAPACVVLCACAAATVAVKHGRTWCHKRRRRL